MTSTASNWIGKLCATGSPVGANIESQVVSFAAATTGAVASKRLFTVNGVVSLTVIAVCSSNLAGSGTLEVGLGDSTAVFIAQSTGTDIDSGEIWSAAAPATSYVAFSDTIPIWYLVNNDHVTYTVGTATLTSGIITFYCLWEPISEGAFVQAAGVNATA